MSEIKKYYIQSQKEGIYYIPNKSVRLTGLVTFCV